MTYATERTRVGRKPFQIVKLSLDYCTLNHGEAPCTAGLTSSGFVQAATSTTVDLDASAPSTDDAYNNFAVYIESGTGVGQSRRITDYDGTLKRATVESAWTTTPDGTSYYLIIDRPNACYNTRVTCQDVPNYTPSTTTNEIYLTEMSGDFPVNLLDTAGLGVAVPCIQKVQTTPPKLAVGEGLGIRSSIVVNCYDFTHHDNGLDKYRASRTYAPEEQGTFWGKLLARNPFYNGRLLTLYRGYLSSADQFDVNNFEQWTYVIEKMDGPSTSDVVKITAKDMLKLTDDERAQIPFPSKGTLTGDLLIGGSSLTLLPAGIGATATADGGYAPTTGYVRINEEIMAYSRSADVLTITARAQWGTVEDDHDAGDTVQWCKAYVDVNVVDVIEDIMTNYTAIDASYLDTANWAIEKSKWLSANNLTNILSDPDGVKSILEDLTKENLLYMWWEPVTRLIKLKAIAPAIYSPTELTDDDNLLENRTSVVQKPELRRSQVWLFYGVRDYTETKVENFRNVYIDVNPAPETDDEYAETKIEKIYSRWITSQGIAIQTAGRLLALYEENIKVATFRLDNKDDVKLGDQILLTTRFLQNSDGSPRSVVMIVTEDREVEPGSINEYKAQQFQLLGRFGFIGYSHNSLLPASVTTVPPILQLDPTTADRTVTLLPDITLDGEFVWLEDILVDHLARIHTGAAAGQERVVVAYNQLLKRATLDFAYTGFGAAIGDQYEITLPDYSTAHLLKEDGDALLLEDGSYITLEDASSTGATELQKTLYAWISPDSEFFDDGTEAYKIL
jgi:hypothetical protein